MAGGNTDYIRGSMEVEAQSINGLGSKVKRRMVCRSDWRSHSDHALSGPRCVDCLARCLKQISKKVGSRETHCPK